MKTSTSNSTMSDDLNARIDAELEYTLAHENDPDIKIDPATISTRPGRKAPRLLTVRLSQDDYNALAKRAEEAGLPVSTYARLQITDTERESKFAADVERVLRSTLVPELLAA